MSSSEAPFLGVAETKRLIREAFQNDEPATTPFRGESKATEAWRAICKRLGPPFLTQVLAEAGEGTPAEAAHRVLDACYRSVDRVHPHLRECLAAASSKNSGDRRKARLAQRNLFFLRFLTCACVHPAVWGVVESSSGPLGESDSEADLSPTRGAAIGRELIKLTSDVTSSSGAVQVFLDRLTNLQEHATVHPMDLRHFLLPASSTKPKISSSSSSSSSSNGGTHLVANKGGNSASTLISALSPPRRKKAASSSAGKRLDRLGLSPIRASKKAAKQGHKASKKGSGTTAFDCFKLPTVGSTILTDAPAWEGSGHSPKLPFDRSVADLDSDGIAQFLFVAGLPDLIDVFRRNSVTGRQLAGFTDSDLEALGLSKERRLAVASLVARHL